MFMPCVVGSGAAMPTGIWNGSARTCSGMNMAEATEASAWTRSSQTRTTTCCGSDAYDDPEGSDWSDCELSDELGPRLGSSGANLEWLDG
jgi:hypothetical protein